MTTPAYLTKALDAGKLGKVAKFHSPEGATMTLGNIGWHVSGSGPVTSGAFPAGAAPEGSAQGSQRAAWAPFLDAAPIGSAVLTSAAPLAAVLRSAERHGAEVVYLTPSGDSLAFVAQDRATGAVVLRGSLPATVTGAAVTVRVRTAPAAACLRAAGRQPVTVEAIPGTSPLNPSPRFQWEAKGRHHAAFFLATLPTGDGAPEAPQAAPAAVVGNTVPRRNPKPCASWRKAPLPVFEFPASREHDGPAVPWHVLDRDQAAQVQAAAEAGLVETPDGVRWQLTGEAWSVAQAQPEAPEVAALYETPETTPQAAQAAPESPEEDTMTETTPAPQAAPQRPPEHVNPDNVGAIVKVARDGTVTERATGRHLGRVQRAMVPKSCGGAPGLVPGGWESVNRAGRVLYGEPERTRKAAAWAVWYAAWEAPEAPAPESPEPAPQAAPEAPQAAPEPLLVLSVRLELAEGRTDYLDGPRSKLTGSLLEAERRLVEWAALRSGPWDMGGYLKVDMWVTWSNGQEPKRQRFDVEQGHTFGDLSADLQRDASIWARVQPEDMDGDRWAALVRFYNSHAGELTPEQLQDRRATFARIDVPMQLLAELDGETPEPDPAPQAAPEAAEPPARPAGELPELTDDTAPGSWVRTPGGSEGYLVGRTLGGAPWVAYPGGSMPLAEQVERLRGRLEARYRDALQGAGLDVDGLTFAELAWLVSPPEQAGEGVPCYLRMDGCDPVDYKVSPRGGPDYDAGAYYVGTLGEARQAIREERLAMIRAGEAPVPPSGPEGAPQAAPEGDRFETVELPTPSGPELAPLPTPGGLAAYDWVLINSSAGKDSMAALRATVEACDAAGIDRARLVVVHADLGDMEWAGTEELAGAQAARYGLRFEVVKRPQGDLLDQVEKRGMWPSPSARFCTSDHKTSQCQKLMTQLGREHRAALAAQGLPKRPCRILSVLGIRAEESSARGKLPSFQVVKAATGKGTVKQVDRWLPVHAWTVGQVWQNIHTGPLASLVHEAYTKEGMTRLSCRFCIMASRPDLVRSAKANPELLARYVEVERRIGHRFTQALSAEELAELAGVELAPQAAPEQPQEVAGEVTRVKYIGGSFSNVWINGERLTVHLGPIPAGLRFPKVGEFVRVELASTGPGRSADGHLVTSGAWELAPQAAPSPAAAEAATTAAELRETADDLGDAADRYDATDRDHWRAEEAEAEAQAAEDLAFYLGPKIPETARDRARYERGKAQHKAATCYDTDTTTTPSGPQAAPSDKDPARMTTPAPDFAELLAGLPELTASGEGSETDADGVPPVSLDEVAPVADLVRVELSERAAEHLPVQLTAGASKFKKGRGRRWSFAASRAALLAALDDLGAAARQGIDRRARADVRKLAAELRGEAPASKPAPAARELVATERQVKVPSGPAPQAAPEAAGPVDLADVSRFKPGQLVEVHAMGHWYLGYVLKVGRKRVTVRYRSGAGAERDKAVGVDKVRWAYPTATTACSWPELNELANGPRPDVHAALAEVQAALAVLLEQEPEARSANYYDQRAHNRAHGKWSREVQAARHALKVLAQEGAVPAPAPERTPEPEAVAVFKAAMTARAVHGRVAYEHSDKGVGTKADVEAALAARQDAMAAMEALTGWTFDQLKEAERRADDLDDAAGLGDLFGEEEEAAPDEATVELARWHAGYGDEDSKAVVQAAELEDAAGLGDLFGEDEEPEPCGHPPEPTGVTGPQGQVETVPCPCPVEDQAAPEQPQEEPDPAEEFPGPAPEALEEAAQLWRAARKAKGTPDYPRAVQALQRALQELDVTIEQAQAAAEAPAPNEEALCDLCGEEPYELGGDCDHTPEERVSLRQAEPEQIMETVEAPAPGPDPDACDRCGKVRYELGGDCTGPDCTPKQGNGAGEVLRELGVMPEIEAGAGDDLRPPHAYPRRQEHEVGYEELDTDAPLQEVDYGVIVAQARRQAADARRIAELAEELANVRSELAGARAELARLGVAEPIGDPVSAILETATELAEDDEERGIYLRQALARALGLIGAEALPGRLRLGAEAEERDSYRGILEKAMEAIGAPKGADLDGLPCRIRALLLSLAPPVAPDADRFPAGSAGRGPSMLLDADSLAAPGHGDTSTPMVARGTHPRKVRIALDYLEAKAAESKARRVKNAHRDELLEALRSDERVRLPNGRDLYKQHVEKAAHHVSATSYWQIQTADPSKA